MKSSFLSLALGLVLFTPQVVAQQEPRKGAKKIDAKELNRQKIEAFKDAEKARKEYKSWVGRITWSLSDPFQDRTSYAGGNVKVLRGEEDANLLWWALKESSDPRGRNMMNASRSLYKGVKLRETYEPRRGTGTVYEYNTAALREFLPQMIIRDGFHKNLELWFDIDIIANARYMKTEPNADDWQALGFSGKEEYENWWKNKKAVISGKESDLSEDRPFASKEDKFDKMNPRNKPMAASGDEQYGKYYIIVLRPKIPALQKRLRSIRMTLRPGDFLPISLMFEYSTDRYRNIQFTSIEKNPEPEITSDQFTLDTEGYRVIQR